MREGGDWYRGGTDERLKVEGWVGGWVRKSEMGEGWVRSVGVMCKGN